MMDSTTDRVARLLRDRAGLFGKYRGKVTLIGTGANLGQIKATVPTVFGKDIESPWCDPVLPFAGDKHGFAFLPQKDDGVWIEFEAGDVSHPLWTGFFWAQNQIPSAVSQDVRLIASSHGHQYVIDDSADEIRFEHGNGAKIVMTKDSITIQVSGKKLVLSASGLSVNDGALEVK